MSVRSMEAGDISSLGDGLTGSWEPPGTGVKNQIWYAGHARA